MVRFATSAMIVLGTAVPLWAQTTPEAVIAGAVPFEQSVLVTSLAGPWEVTWGPDDMLWVTERVVGRINRIDPATGKLSKAFTFADSVANGGQDGLLGIALDPGLLQGLGRDYVYAAYTYIDKQRPADPTVTDPASPYRNLFTKLVRLSYDPVSGLLSDPITLIEGLPAGADHNSGRMAIGPDGKIHYTLGDQGNDQLANFCIPIESQRLPTADELAARDFIAYQGKVLRLNLDGTVPLDNPVLAGVRSHVFTYGHRNMQGIAFGPDGTLYGSEQGPKTDDEVNILTAGGNYGWPHVVGYRDDMAYQYARWADATTPCATLEFSDITIHPSVPREDESAWQEPFNPPLATLFTVPDDWDFTDPLCKGMDFICWPTVAASSIEVYRPTSGGIPGFDNALLVTALKRGSVYRVPLSADGLTAAGPIERYFQTENRYRDLAISPDGQTIFVATDPGGLHEASAGGVSDQVANSGAILVFRHMGQD